ncbi:MAG: DNA-processing protein DprA [Pseudomonadota bacterium]
MQSPNIRSKVENKFFGIALNLVSGIGCVLYKRLIDYFKKAEAVFDTSIQELMTIDGIGHETALAIKNFNQWDLVEDNLSMAKKVNARILTLEDEDYPTNLKKTNDPPPVIYTKGEIKKDDKFAIAVVGSRSPSVYGKSVARSINRDLANEGITIVSGMARGIDAISHKEALSAGGRTIAVLGSGIDVIYPPENRELFNKICCNGAVITEFPVSTPPNAVNFPNRNRIISGLSLGVVIVEAGVKSGSLITARFAVGQGKKIFAVPGQVGSVGSKGTNKLIKEGAMLVESADDVMSAILPQYRDHTNNKEHTKKSDNLSEMAKQVLATLTEGPLHIDTVVNKSKLNVNEVSSILLNLELSGLIVQLPGKIFMRTS